MGLRKHYTHDNCIACSTAYPKSAKYNGYYCPDCRGGN